jgi:hypothetical protein
MDKYEKLKELKTLLDNGVLNQDEFNKLKNEILFSDDKITSDESEITNNYSKPESFDNEQKNYTKSNVERNIFEEIAFKNNQKINYNIPQKNNNNLIYFAVFIGVILFFFFQNNNNVVNDSNQNSSQDTTTTSNSSDYSSSSTSSSSSSSYSSDNKCSWCGKSFSGEHYTHLGKMSDCYSTSSSSSIGVYCSLSCCSQARRSSCPTCR